ncbi:MAG: formate--tetrahydrofolate ligase [Intestinimonas sp.]
MAVCCISASDLMDLKTRLGRMVVAAYNRAGRRYYCSDLKARGGYDRPAEGCHRPNLVQTLEHTPASASTVDPLPTSPTAVTPFPPQMPL